MFESQELSNNKQEVMLSPVVKPSFCMYVCMYVCMYGCMYVRTYVCMYVMYVCNVCM